MDRKSITLLALTALLFLTWPMLVNKIYPPIPVKPTNSVTLGTNSSLPGAVITSAGTNLIAAGTNIAAFSTNAPVGKEENVVIQNDLATYHFSSFGGGLKLVEFAKYKSIVGCKADKAATNPPASVNKKATWPMFTIQDNDGLVGDNVFRLSSTGQTVRAEKTLTNGVTLVKEFQILSNYQIKVTTRWENHGQAPARVPGRLMVIGTATPTGAYDELRTLGLDWYDGKKAQRIDRTFFEPSGWLFKSPAKDIYSGGQSNIQWAATHNRFFTTVVTPETTPQQIQGRKVDLPAPTAEETAGDARKVVNPSGIVGSFALPEVTIPADRAFVEHYDAYAGPKEYKILSRLRNDVDLVMNLTGFFGWFAKILLMSMNGLYSFGISYGWAIVVITVILKLLFYPLTAASTRSMKRMSSLQPQMKAIQEKYKEDPTKMNQKLQEFMKEHKINPLGSCLPILLTIPVFGGFWFMLNSAIELRGAQFMWACDLSAPDTLFVIPGLNIPINGFAIIMIVTMMWQSHMTPPSPGVDPAQQKMMRYMPLVIVPFIYNQAAGLTLYWSVQNLLSIIQMKLTKDKPEDPAKPGVGKPVPVAPVPRRKA